MATPTFEIDTPCLQGAALSYAFAKAEYEGEKNALGIPVVIQTKIVGVFVDGRLFDIQFVNVGELITKYQISVSPTTFFRGGKIINGYHAKLTVSSNGCIRAAVIDGYHDNLYQSAFDKDLTHAVTGATLNEAVCRLVVLYKSGDKVKIPFHAEISVGEFPATWLKDGDVLDDFGIYYTPCSGYFCSSTEKDFVDWFSEKFSLPPVDYRALSKDEALVIVVNIPSMSIDGGMMGMNLVALAKKMILDQGGYKQPFQI